MLALHQVRDVSRQRKCVEHIDFICPGFVPTVYNRAMKLQHFLQGLIVQLNCGRSPENNALGRVFIWLRDTGASRLQQEKRVNAIEYRAESGMP